MTTLTPEIAKDLMWRSMTTGAPTSEFNKYGGYDAVASMYNQSGGTYSLADISPEFKQQAAQTIAQTGVGNLALLGESQTPLSAAAIANMAKNGIDTGTIERAIGSYGVAGSGGISSSQYEALQKQMAELQAQYDRLRQSGSGGGSTGGIVGGGVVDDGSTFNPGGTGGLGTGGVVYGPDGTAYSSAAAAIAAGVTNFTYTKPVVPQTPAGPGLIQGADNLTAVPPAASGNANPGGLIAGQIQQLFNLGPPKVALPSGVRNPFAV